MNTLLWCLQALTALLYAASGTMKVFMFEKISHDVPSFGALPRGAWTILGVLEIVCVLGLIIPGLFHWRTTITVYAAALLAAESLVFIWVHIKYLEFPPLIISGALGLVMAFIAYGRKVLSPLA